MIFAIGDIHGRADMLARMLDHIRPKMEQGDTLVFTGDYIDRGMESKQVIDLILSWRKDFGNTICLTGNHEVMMMDCLIAPSPEQRGDGLVIPGCMQGWFHNGGWHTLRSYGITEHSELLWWKDVLPIEHIEFLLRLPIEHKEEKWHFVHAGLPEPGADPRANGYDCRLWMFDFNKSETDFGRRVVYGHMVQDSQLPLILPNQICIDTGCGRGGPLTCLVMPPDATQPVRWHQIHEVK